MFVFNYDKIYSILDKDIIIIYKSYFKLFLNNARFNTLPISPQFRG